MSQVAIVQKKPHMYELLNLAAKQKLSIKETRVEICKLFILTSLSIISFPYFLFTSTKTCFHLVL